MKTGGQGNAGGQAGRILLYDDDLVLLDALRIVLLREGYAVKSTHSEREALTLARGECFDLAIADLGLRRSRGYQVVEAIRQNRPETPVLAMTACLGTEVARFAREYAQALLQKPFSLSEMVRTARCILQGERWEGAEEYARPGEASFLGPAGALGSNATCPCHMAIDEGCLNWDQGGPNVVEIE